MVDLWKKSLSSTTWGVQYFLEKPITMNWQCTGFYVYTSNQNVIQSIYYSLYDIILWHIICIQEPDRPASNISDACANEVYQELLNCCARYDCQQAIDSVQVNISTILVSTKKVDSFFRFLLHFLLFSHQFLKSSVAPQANCWLSLCDSRLNPMRAGTQVSFRLCQYKVCLIRPYLWSKHVTQLWLLSTPGDERL